MISSPRLVRPLLSHPLLRALACWTAFILLLFLITVTFVALVGRPDRIGYGLLGTLAALTATAIFYRRSYWRLYGLLPGRRTLVHFGAGLLGGLALLALIVWVICIASGVRLAATGSSWGWPQALGLFGFVPLALMEELPFRGAPFRHLAARTGLRTAQFAGAIAFALYHIANGWGMAQSLLGPFIWAFVFGVAAFRSGGIAAPTGLHAGVNIGQSLVGLGMGATQPLWRFAGADGSSEGALEKTTPAGIALQVLLLVAALVFTERLIRKRRSTAAPLPPGQ
ncbi:CPBP family intramembrane glutamic endopeptidase [Flaviaesturariibacter aridisoli]|uniref:CPBP family intramembrane metalloprotease n=1 Tax=Flaviaesturariibacter aridisoli TaxID=2545761 RepID=A0A4R4E5W4_9BACT|nr:type II CAAX endopeptidase family protein [Flaviaesturariibacter aridisoli]TCZ74869.1 CPBP family intramembrane metalloprotease [Flaviaesturariibacter aridisoli]